MPTSTAKLQVTVAVGTTIADRPPHRTVRARLRIRLPPWMSGDKAIHRVRVQDARYWNPAVQNRAEPIPGCPTSLTATDYGPERVVACGRRPGHDRPKVAQWSPIVPPFTIVGR